MPRGGKRAGAGRKSSWNEPKTKTKVIRVPEALAEQLLDLAKQLDRGEWQAPDSDRALDLAKLPIRQASGKPAVCLEDLLKAGYTLNPPQLERMVRSQMQR